MNKTDSEREEKMGQQFKVLAEDLNNNYPSSLFNFKDTSELEPIDSIIGQKR